MTNENSPNITVSNRNPTTGWKATIEDADLDTMKRWVKDDFFQKVKFIYNADKELKVDSDYFKLFVKDCKDRLIGLKARQGNENKELRKMYIQMLWQQANKPNVDIVKNGLIGRRSSIYTAMNNKFDCKLGIKCQNTCKTGLY